MAIELRSSDSNPLSWRALRENRGLCHHSAACGALRLRAGGCTVCVDACPVGALRQTPAGMVVDDTCMDCGRCVPACPMGALMLPSCQGEVGDAAALRVDCRRVPRATRGEVTLSCLGALDVAAVLELHRQAAGRVVELCDRGWCGGCPAGGAEHPARAVLDATNVWMEALGVPRAQWPRRVQAPLPERLSEPADASLAPEVPLSRRAFFRQLVDASQRAAAVEAPAALEPGAATLSAHSSFSRARLVDAVEALARATAVEVPSALYAQIHVSNRCRNHQGCARVCPTGALQGYRGAEASGLRFDPRSCIACGLCERHCPEQALRMTAGGYALMTSERETYVLTRHGTGRCSECGAEYAVRADGPDDGRCDPCRKSRGLFARFFEESA